MIGEAVLFAGLAVALSVRVDGWGRWGDVRLSLGGAPRWVRAWVWLGLLPANIAAFVAHALAQHPVAAAGVLAFSVVIASSMALILVERGISRASSIPHLVRVLPVGLALWWLLARPDELAAQGLAAYAWAYVVVHAVSLAFDAHDTWRWARGERGTIPPRPAGGTAAA